MLKGVETEGRTCDASENQSGRRYRESRHRLRRFCFNLFLFLLPIAVEVASSAASAELHQIRHIRHRHVANHGRHGDDILHHSFDISNHSHDSLHFKEKNLHHGEEVLRHPDGTLRRSFNILRHRRFSVPEASQNGSSWPVKRVAEIYGDIVIGGLHMIHEREDAIICGPVMPQGGLQALMNCRRYVIFKDDQ